MGGREGWLPGTTDTISEDGWRLACGLSGANAPLATDGQLRDSEQWRL